MMATEVESGVGEDLVGVVVVGCRPFEIEEDQLGGGCGGALLRGGHCGAPVGVVSGGGERQHGVVAGP